MTNTPHHNFIRITLISAAALFAVAAPSAADAAPTSAYIATPGGGFPVSVVAPTEPGGHQISVEAEQNSTVIVVSDPAGVTPGAGCTARSATVAACTVTQPSTFVVGSPGDDAITIGSGGVFTSGTAVGDAGNDSITIGTGAYQLDGGGGNDVLTGGPFKNGRIAGGPGDDVIAAGEGGYGKGGISEYLYGGPGDDSLDGGPGKDELLGGPGDDRMVGGPDSDRLQGDGGFDRLFTRDGELDVYSCGENGHYEGGGRAKTDGRDVGYPDFSTAGFRERAKRTFPTQCGKRGR